MHRLRGHLQPRHHCCRCWYPCPPQSLCIRGPRCGSCGGGVCCCVYLLLSNCDYCCCFQDTLAYVWVHHQGQIWSCRCHAAAIIHCAACGRCVPQGVGGVPVGEVAMYPQHTMTLDTLNTLDTLDTHPCRGYDCIPHDHCRHPSRRCTKL